MKIAPISLAIGLAFAASPSYALIVSVTASTSANVVVNGLAENAFDGPSGDAASALNAEARSVDVGYYSGVGSAYASADAQGRSQLSSNGPGYTPGSFLESPLSLNVRSSILQTAIITNDTSFAQQVDFNFLIGAGGLYTTYGVSGGGSVFNVGYTADIRVNGNTQWGSHASLETNANEFNTLTRDGAFLNGNSLSDINAQLALGGSYYWDAYSSNLNLGVLGAGQSLTVDYALSTYVNIYLDAEGYSSFPHASIGDPFDFNSTPVFAPEQFVTAVVPSVPEPETVAMFGVGLAALAFRRKSRKAQA